MNYYPDNNEFDSRILSKVSQRQGQELFTIWAEKIIRKVYDESYHYVLGEPDIKDATLGILSCRKNDALIYKIVVATKTHVIDADLMPGVYLDGDAVTAIDVKYADNCKYLSKTAEGEREHELITTTMDIFHLKICKPENACFVCYDETTNRFFEVSDNATIIQDFFRHVEVLDRRLIELSIAPHPGFKKLFETCKDVNCLLDLKYDISYSIDGKHKIDVWRREDGSCMNQLASGLTDEQVEILLSFALNTVCHLKLNDAPNLKCTAFLYRYNSNVTPDSLIVPLSCHVGK